MTYYISIFILTFKTFLIYLNNHLLNYSLKNFFVIITILLLIILIIKYIKSIPSKDTEEERILKYCYGYHMERYYSIFILSISAIVFIGGILFLRLNNSGNTTDLKSVFSLCKKIYANYPLIIIILNIIIIILILYVIILIIKEIKWYLHKEAVKLHIYYLRHKIYRKVHQKFSFDYSLHNRLIPFIDHKYRKFMYKKAIGINKSYLKMTTEERKKLDDLFERVEYYFPFPKIINILFPNLHYFLLASFVFYDIFGNDYILQYTYKYLPFMFIYQIYVSLSNFVTQKTLSDTCNEAHLIFYHKVVITEIKNKKIMIIDDGQEIFELNIMFNKQFLNYEASGFTKYDDF